MSATEDALRNELAAAIASTLAVHTGVPVAVVQLLIIEASNLAITYHAQRQGVTATADVIVIVDERPE